MSKITCEILELSPDKIKFVLNNCDVSLANALRRILLSEVPTLAPHLVNIIENTSVLHDEFLAQRIGLIPFFSHRVDDFKYAWECDCMESNVEDCQVCKAYFTLQAENKSQEPKEVTSLDIRPVFQPLDDESSDRKPVLPVDFYSDFEKGKKIGIPIIKLDRNQKINMKFDVQKGIGKMHAKWSPVSLATFQPDPEIKIDEKIELTMDDKLAIVDSCPKKVFELNEGNLQTPHQDQCIFCGECKRCVQSRNMAKFKNLIRVGKKKDRYIFTVEGVGSMLAGTIVKNALRVLREKLNDLQDKIR